MVRKPPIRHKVRSHEREGKSVREFERGSGQRLQRSRRVVKSTSHEDEYETIPGGECYRYTFKGALNAIVESKPNIVIVHATVQSWPTDPRYNHARIEDDDKVYDWQTMVMGSSKYAGEGWPKDLFYETFKPEDVQKYSPEQVVEYTRKTGHMGPWSK